MKRFKSWNSLLAVGVLGGALLAPHAGFCKGATTPAGAGSKMSSKPGGKMGSMSSQTQMTGMIVSIAGRTLTVKPTAQGAKAASKTVGVPIAAKIMLGQKSISLSSLKRGQKITVYMTNGKTTRVVAFSQAMMKPKTSSKMSSKMSSAPAHKS